MARWKELGGAVKVYKTIKARALWDLICTAAWRSAEPGLHFLERSNKWSNTWYFERLQATNPCGEQPLGPWAVCNLGAMNLSAYVKGDDLANDKAGTFDFKSFGEDVKTAMRFLDNVIDDTYYFYEQNEKCAKDIRRTGLGIMGIADALIKMKITYGSDESLPVIKKIFATLRDNAYDASADIAKEKGAFPMFDKEKYMQGHHIKALPKAIQEKIAKHGIRNAVLLTIAPTGTTSLLSGVSSGIEPVYEFTFVRRDRTGEHILYHPLLEVWKEAHPTEERPAYFVSSNDLTPLEHARVQAIAQEYIDSSISKTVNAPNAHTIDDVKTLYMMAYDMGLKGVTYFRDGSRAGVLERVDEKKKEEPKVEEKAVPAEPIIPATPRVSRPMMLTGTTYKTVTPTGKAYITINHDEKNDPFEVFINNGKAGSDLMAMADALGRMISFVLRIHSPVPARERMREIISEISGLGGARSVGFGENRVRSLPDAVAKTLAKHSNFRVNGKVEDKEILEQVRQASEEATDQTAGSNGVSNGMSHGEAKLPLNADAAMPQGQLAMIPQQEEKTYDMASSTTNLFDICPECGTSSFAYEEGCKKCYSCGYSEC
jgi:ribonucleoside-diphosphate reductase alpha chain